MPSFFKIALYASILVNVFGELSEASNVDREMRRGRGGRRGNERSERVTQITPGYPNYSGNGCPEGTMRMAFSPDNLSFSILFDQFIAELKEGAQQRRDIMACDVMVPIQIPEGIQMEITRVDFRGFVALPERVRAAMASQFSFQGARGYTDNTQLRYRFSGPSIENYEISSDVIGDSSMAPSVGTSPCGGMVFLRIRNQVSIISGRSSQQATATIDSIDGAGQSVYHVNWRACSPRRLLKTN